MSIERRAEEQAEWSTADRVAPDAVARGAREETSATVKTVVLRLPGTLRGHADGQSELAFEVADGARLGDLLDEVAMRWPALERRLRDERGVLRRYVNVYIGDVDARDEGGLAATLPAGADVLVVPSVAGG
jgi:molybdopterin converting factor small subunit